MAEEGDVLVDLDAAEGANGADNQPTAGVIQQYIKDLSVENPNAPASYQWNEQPQVDVQFNIGAVPVNDEIQEIELKITVNAKTEQGTIYIVELSYAALVGMRNLPEDQMHAFAYAEAPRQIFPFARNVVADAVRDAGYPALLLDPIDFNGLYAQQLQQRQAEEAAGGGADAPAGDS